MNKEEKAYLFCQRHINNYKIQFKTFDRFPLWWDNIPYWSECFEFITEKEYINISADKLDSLRKEVLKDMADDYKDSNKGRLGGHKVPDSFFKGKEKYIWFLVQKKACINYFKSC